MYGCGRIAWGIAGVYMLLTIAVPVICTVFGTCSKTPAPRCIKLGTSSHIDYIRFYVMYVWILCKGLGTSRAFLLYPV